MSNEEVMDIHPLADRVARLEHELRRTNRLLGRVAVATLAASLTARNLGHETAKIIKSAGLEPAVLPLLHILQEQIELLNKAVAEAANGE